MDIKVVVNEKNPDIKDVILSGRLDRKSAEIVSSVVLDAIEESFAGIILDMGNVSYISSAGLRILLVAYKSANASDKKIALIQTQPQVYKVFKVAFLSKIFNIFKDDDQAIKELWK